MIRYVYAQVFGYERGMGYGLLTTDNPKLTTMLKIGPVACNNGAGGSTEKNVKLSIHLTEPQGKIRRYAQSNSG